MVQGIYLNTSRNLKRLALAHSIEKKLVHVVTSLNKQGATTRPRFILTLSTSHPRFWTLAANLPSIRRAKRFCALSRSHQQHHFIWIWRTILSCRCHGCKWLLTSMKWEVASAKPFFFWNNVQTILISVQNWKTHLKSSPWAACSELLLGMLEVDSIRFYQLVLDVTCQKQTQQAKARNFVENWTLPWCFPTQLVKLLISSLEG